MTDHRKESEPASEILANALQILWHPSGGSLRSTHFDRADIERATELVKEAKARAQQQEAETRHLREQIDSALSVDGVTPDDAPLIVDAYSPANAWVEGYQAGQESVFAELPNDPNKNSQGGAAPGATP